MKPLVLTLRGRPGQRLDLSPVVPQRLAGLSEAEIGRIALNTTRDAVTLGDAFKMRKGDPRHIRIEGACDRLDQVGQGMSEGTIEVAGDVGAQAGRRMAGGRLVIDGTAGPWAASGMTRGVIEIAGSAGARLGGPLAGETAGMRGGVVLVRGDAGERVGDRLRRGTIIVEGSAGAHAGSRMIAGTVLVRGKAGPLPGYLMSRGTLLLGGGTAALSPTFVDCGRHELVAMRLLASFVTPYSARIARLLGRPLRRLAGDMAVQGLGEIFLCD
jgi:formylmethanofuran dehydrogenase subunit C